MSELPVSAAAAPSTIRVAVDAMGGDHAPASVIAGGAIARERYPRLHLIFFGDEAQLRPLIAAEPRLQSGAEIRHTTEQVAADAKPAQALKAGRGTSMRMALDAVAAGEAACAVSAGNTGALMAMARFVLKMLPGIERPAIAAFFPTLRGETVMLDLGANLECDDENLVQFALMGGVFARVVLGLQQPTIGLLNIGSEDQKGDEALRLAAQRLRALPLPGTFSGFVEGNDIPTGAVDVVVADGFSGNVALKTAEGTAKFYSELLRRAFKSSLLASIGYLFAGNALRKLRERTDPRRYNGAMFLGLAGLCVKSHGGADALGFANALSVAHDLAEGDFNRQIRQQVAQLQAAAGTAPLELVPATTL